MLGPTPKLDYYLRQRSYTSVKRFMALKMGPPKQKKKKNFRPAVPSNFHIREFLNCTHKKRHLDNGTRREARCRVSTDEAQPSQDP